MRVDTGLVHGHILWKPGKEVKNREGRVRQVQEGFREWKVSLIHRIPAIIHRPSEPNTHDPAYSPYSPPPLPNPSYVTSAAVVRQRRAAGSRHTPIKEGIVEIGLWGCVQWVYESVVR